MKLKALAGAAALVALACGSVVFASDDQQASSSTGNLPVLMDTAGPATTPGMAPETPPPPASAPATSPASTTPPPTPAMYFLEKTSFGQWLSNNNFNITGYVEGGYFYDTNNPSLGTGITGDAPTFITFPGSYSNRVLLDQLDLTLSKSLDTTGDKKFDWGFTFETGYGTDYSYFHSHGLLDNRPPGDPQNQYDITQANVLFLLPVGSGLTVTAGKFLALLGQEVNSPVGNLFYTHSYSFFYGVPDNNTGVLGSYTFSKLVNGNDWTATAGFSNGWNQSLRDNNSAIDFLGQFKGSINSALSIVTNIEEGPEAAHDNSDYWTTIEAIPSLTVSDQLTLTADCLYSDAPHLAATTAGESAQWYGVCGYASYKINGMFTLNCRGEWFRDQGGLETGNQANYYELTVGTQIHPLPNDPIFQFLEVRPEIRGDAADRRVYNTSHPGFGDYSELTAAVDVIMQF
jgi:Putative beta-barrel porin-2, OmpL-like. bbp2